jgi:capsular exopolysaccharide synthesis family protein
MRDYFRIVSQRKWTAIFVLLVVVGGALFLSYRQSPVYGSEAEVLVPPPAAGVTPDTGTVISGKVNLETEAAIASSKVIATPVAKALGLDPTDERVIDKLLRSVRVAPSKAGDILLFQSEASDPVEAQRIAQQFGLSYLDYRRSQNVATLNAQATTLQSSIDEKQAQLDKTPDTLANVQARSALAADIQAFNDRLTPLQSAIKQIRDSSGGILTDAKVSSKPSRPNHIRDGLLAVIVGLVLGFGAAFLRDYVDDSLRGVSDVERMSGATLVGVIQHMAGSDVARSKSRNGQVQEYLVAVDDPKAPATEAYRTLRTNLLFMSAVGPLKVLLVTSPLQGEGKSTTAANLATVLAQAGQRVLLVGADLRRPSVHSFFGLSNRIGLSSVLSGQAQLAEAVQDPGIRDLRVMPGGPIPPNPAELLGSPRMKDLLTEVSDVADWIVLDGPPVLGLADALVLSAIADGTLMVVNEATNRRILAHARDQLVKVSSRTVGVVLNNFGPAFSYYYSDYYMYSSTYYAAPESEPEEPAKQKKPSRKERKREAERVAMAGFAPPAADPEGAPPTTNGSSQSGDEAATTSGAGGLFTD